MITPEETAELKRRRSQHFLIAFVCFALGAVGEACHLALPLLTIFCTIAALFLAIKMKPNIARLADPSPNAGGDGAG